MGLESKIEAAQKEKRRKAREKLRDEISKSPHGKSSPNERRLRGLIADAFGKSD